MSDDKALLVSEHSPIVVPEQLKAINAIRQRKVPDDAKKQRPGKGGQSWTYVEHTWVTRTLQEGLQNQWSFEVLDWEVFREEIKVGNAMKPSVNVAARCQFTLHIVVDEGIVSGEKKILQRRITEVGVFEKMPSMPTAMAIASAASRGLCRCVMRALGLGLEFYESDDIETTPAEAWTALKTFAEKQGIDWTKEWQDEFIAELDKAGITRENIVDRYDTAYHILAKRMGKVTKIEEMPGVNDGEKKEGRTKRKASKSSS
ncbi:MAG: Rad52/Rad22 family DNA repair protein [Planctomycetota bacterium]|jgi:hypothetical protein